MRVNFNQTTIQVDLFYVMNIEWLVVKRLHGIDIFFMLGSQIKTQGYYCMLGSLNIEIDIYFYFFIKLFS